MQFLILAPSEYALRWPRHSMRQREGRPPCPRAKSRARVLALGHGGRPSRWRIECRGHRRAYSEGARMRNCITNRIVFLSLAVALALGGCGYHVGGRGSALP